MNAPVNGVDPRSGHKSQHDAPAAAVKSSVPTPASVLPFNYIPTYCPLFCKAGFVNTTMEFWKADKAIEHAELVNKNSDSRSTVNLVLHQHKIGSVNRKVHNYLVTTSEGKLKK